VELIFAPGIGRSLHGWATTPALATARAGMSPHINFPSDLTRCRREGLEGVGELGVPARNPPRIIGTIRVLAGWGEAGLRKHWRRSFPRMVVRQACRAQDAAEARGQLGGYLFRGIATIMHRCVTHCRATPLAQSALVKSGHASAS